MVDCPAFTVMMPSLAPKASVPVPLAPMLLLVTKRSWALESVTVAPLEIVRSPPLITRELIAAVLAAVVAAVM